MRDRTVIELTLQSSSNVPITATTNLGRKQGFKLEVGECLTLVAPVNDVPIELKKRSVYREAREQMKDRRTIEVTSQQ